MILKWFLAAAMSVSFVAVTAGSSFAATDSTAQCDLKLGKKISKKCKICHTFNEGGKKKVGPNLFHVFGRAAGSTDGFKYSKAMKAKGAEGLVWNAETLNIFLTKPKKFVPKTRMSFPGIKKDDKRAALLCWLEQETGGMQ